MSSQMTFAGYCKCGHHRDRHTSTQYSADGAEHCRATISAIYDGVDAIVECPCTEFNPERGWGLET